MIGRRLSCAMWVSAALAGLTGCISTVPHGPLGSDIALQGWQALKARRECCYMYAQLPRQALPEGSSGTVIDVDASRESYRFNDQKAFVVVLDLPAYRHPYAIHLSSLPLGSKLDQAILVPMVIMLDEGFQPTRHFDAHTLRSRDDELERTIFINPVNAAERHLLIYGAPDVSTKVRDVPLVSPNHTVLGPIPFTFADGTDAKAKLSTSPVGKIRVLVNATPSP